MTQKMNILCLISISVMFSLQSLNATGDVISLSVVACGDRVQETLVLLKSALMFTKNDLYFYIFTEPSLKSLFITQFEKWPKYIQNKFKYSIRATTFPSKDRDEWRTLFKMCASQRLFLPEILETVDSLLYTDTDVLFLSDLNEIWKHFYLFNQSQLAALAPEHEDPNIGWYNRFARHPYYGRLGLNSGVMLMNLTRMREFNFVDRFFPLFKEYKYNITWGDQCLLNILFHYHPDRLYLYDCIWNYRPDHCMYGSNCQSADAHGAKILHGCRRVFHNDKEPAFKYIYMIFDNYNFEDEKRETFLKELEVFYEQADVKSTYCGITGNDIFIKQLKIQLESHKQIIRDAKLRYQHQFLTNEL